MEKNEYAKMYSVEDGHWWFCAKRNFARFFLDKLNRKPLTILDVGCGTGRNLLMLKKYGRVFGVDFNPLALNYCRRRGLTRLQQAGAEKLPFNANRFDLVTIFDVLYHRGIRNDKQALKEAYRVVKPKGFILLTDCVHPWLFGPHDEAMQARQRYSKKELTGKVEQVGFRIIRTSYIFMFTFPLFLINRLLKKYFRFGGGSDVTNLPRLINRILLLVNLWEGWLLSNFNLPLGSSIIVLAQKP